MNERIARRARRIAQDGLAYRAWYIDAMTAPIPAIKVLTDPRLHRREHDRQLRRAQNGFFDTVAMVAAPARLHTV